MARTMEMSLRVAIQFCNDIISDSYIWNWDQAEKWCPFLRFSSPGSLQAAQQLNSCGWLTPA